jgi:plastocyanin
MNPVPKVIVTLLILALLAGGGYIAFHKKGPNAASPVTSTSPATSAPKTDSTNSDTTPVAATITFTDSGFSPSLVTVKSGDTIRISNKSSQPIELDSDPHPAHTDDTELNVGIVSSGSSKTFVLTTKGNWGYHDHLSAGFTGRINVQ